MAGGPNEGGTDNQDVGGGLSKDSHGWTDNDGTHHRESVTYDRDGDVHDYHYVQHDNEGSKMVYDYLTGEWKDKSR